MLEYIATNLQSLSVSIVALGIIGAAWMRYVVPAAVSIKSLVAKANRVFDAILTEYEVHETNGGTTKLSLPQLMLRIVAWQVRHDERYPEDVDEGKLEQPMSGV